MEHTPEELLRKKAQTILRALNHPARRQILQLLDQYGKMTIDEICKRLQLENFSTSQHLAILKETQFVTLVDNGRLYTVNYDQVKEAHHINKQLR
jgi:DNA-binding transcriptional ArsR family regulator